MLFTKTKLVNKDPGYLILKLQNILWIPEELRPTAYKFTNVLDSSALVLYCTYFITYVYVKQ